MMFIAYLHIVFSTWLNVAGLCRPSLFAQRHTRHGKCAPCGLTEPDLPSQVATIGARAACCRVLPSVAECCRVVPAKLVRPATHPTWQMCTLWFHGVRFAIASRNDRTPCRVLPSFAERCRVLPDCAGQVGSPDDTSDVANVHLAVSRRPICHRKLRRSEPVSQFAELCRVLSSVAEFCRVVPAKLVRPKTHPTWQMCTLRFHGARFANANCNDRSPCRVLPSFAEFCRIVLAN